MNASDHGRSEAKQAAIAELDHLEIRDNQGNVAARIGYCVTLFFDQGGTLPKRMAAFNIYKQYCHLFVDHLSHYQAPGSDSVRRLKDLSFLESSASKLEKIPEKEPVDFAVFSHGPTGKGGEDDGVGHFGFAASCVAPDKPGELMPVDRSSISAFISAGWVIKHGHARLLELVRDWSSQLEPLHGFCGLSILFDIIYGSTATKLHAFPYLKRFPGLHCGDSSMFTVEIQPHNSQYLFTTNWLTVLSADFSHRVGGVEKLAAAMGETCPIHEYSGGIIIQAGDQAQIGDVNRGLVIDDYRRVASAVKPIRFEDYKIGLFPVPEPLDALEETMEWISRFD
ncbi:DUF3396 domain-containing protein [Phyllobacterium sp. 628]|uniref:type VI immunity family protein n=1 Tax=Phyllobacterium sp. 628 TaxID=2718938 RepID=UPI0016627AA2|nr:type VI immunity family protein [Phyllobacterium sp. 628]QND51898.1 DUF3396 domain-containing protein [Phyllobacterium sp. 628]